MSNDKRVYRLLKSKKISVGKAEDGTFLCSIPHNGNKEILDIHSSNFRIAFKSFWKKEYGELLNDKEVQEIISIIEVECYESKNKIQRNHRIYTKGRMLIYQLNTDNNTSVRIEDGECEIEETPDFMFYTDRNFKNQVEPDLNVMPEELLPYIRKHFNVKDEDDVILISILIVSSMLGMNFNHPVILIQGEKGSGKSECLKKLEMIIDPKDSGICAYTSNKEAIVLRLSKSYFTCFDNVSFISKLREWGVEVFFYNDGIWSLEQDGELRLTIMSAMAQEESKHISERVRAGQRISREKGVLYGNGNILGYRLIKGKKSIDNTYEIIEEEAETVRMIYDLYLTGMGAKTIAGKMVEMKRKKADGTYNWEHLSVLRILNNKTYAGYISYNKSYTKNFLGHKRVTVRDVSQYEYVKGNFPAIVSEETWNRVQAIKSKKVVIVDGRKCSKPISKDKWCRHLVCECGSVYGKCKWRTNKNGEVSNGYQCRHQIRYRKRSFHEKQGLDGTGYCNVPSICEWKLDFMAKSILERLWKDQKSSVEELLQDIQDNYSEETGITDREYQIEKLKRESERLKNRMSNLVDMKLDDLIGSEEFEDKKCTIDERMLQIKNELAILSQDEEDNEPVEVEGEIKKIKEYLNGVCDLNQKQLSDELVDAVIARITPMENGAFKWYIQGEEYDTETSFDESKYVLYDRFTLNFEEAKKYRKAFGNFIRAVQWKDLIVEVYIRQD